MKFLASMTIMLAIPTVISSFFGMNVDIPFASAGPNGFLYVSIIAIVLTSLCAFVLWRKDMF